MKHILFLLSFLTLVACNQPAQDPKSVAQQYWQALIDGDTKTARLLITTDSQSSFDANLAAIDKTIKQVALDDQHTTVSTTINPDTDKPYRDRPFNTVMIIESGAWKIDLTQTRIPPATTGVEQQLNELANELSESMEENINTMEDVMGEGMQLLNDILRDGSREMGDSFLKGMREMKDAMRESIETMKQRRENMQDAPSSDKQPDYPAESNDDTQSDTGEGML